MYFIIFFSVFLSNFNEELNAVLAIALKYDFYKYDDLFFSFYEVVLPQHFMCAAPLSNFR